MNRSSAIRPEFVKAYHLRDRANWSDRLDALRERDAQYKALNARYGIEDSISYGGQRDPAYDLRYKEISAEFGPRYASIATQECDWSRRSDMTIPEFLFLDNLTFELKDICDRRDFDSLHYFSFVEIKAQVRVDRWKTEVNYRGMSQRVIMEIEDFHYARKRCWEHFGFPLWDIDAWKQARLYRRIYARSLCEILDRTRIA